MLRSQLRRGLIHIVFAEKFFRFFQCFIVRPFSILKIILFKNHFIVRPFSILKGVTTKRFKSSNQ